MNSTFMSLMIAGIIVSTFSIFLVLQQVWVTERNKADTLSLYALLRMSEIKKVYDKCDAYLDSLMVQGRNGSDQVAEELANSVAAGNNQGNELVVEDSDLSEEEKEEQMFHVQLQAKQSLRLKNAMKLANRKAIRSNFTGHARYSAMIKKTVGQIRDIQERDD